MQSVLLFSIIFKKWSPFSKLMLSYMFSLLQSHSCLQGRCLQSDVLHRNVFWLIKCSCLLDGITGGVDKWLNSRNDVVILIGAFDLFNSSFQSFVVFAVLPSLCFLFHDTLFGFTALLPKRPTVVLYGVFVNIS